MMDKATQLRRRKRAALCLLLLASLLFIVSLCLPPHWSVAALKAMSEAAMVGGLADWFAVTALFHKIPLIKHSRIIPRNKQRIGENLGRFIEQKFLNPTALNTLIERHNPAHKLALWLLEANHRQALTRGICQLLGGIINASQDQTVSNFFRRLLGSAIDHWDLRNTLSKLIESLVRDDRHQDLLDKVIAQLAKWLANDATRHRVANHIEQWFRQEYPTASKLVSSQWFGEKGADKISQIIDQLLEEVANDPHHHLRNRFNRSIRRFVHRLQQDPQLAERLVGIKQWIKQDPTFNQYMAELISELRHWLTQDLKAPDSRTEELLDKAALWLGKQLSQDPQLTATLNQYLQQAVISLGPESTQFISRHIRDTLHSWDDQLLVQQIELNIGSDLQIIRINGTLVGGVIGLLLFLISQLPPLFIQWLG